MTEKELKEIGETYHLSMEKYKISVNDLVAMGIASHSDIPKLLYYIKKLESNTIRWIHVIDNPPKENEEVLFGVFDPTTQIFQGYIRDGCIFSDFFENNFLPERGMYWQVLPGLPKNIYKDLEEK